MENFSNKNNAVSVDESNLELRVHSWTHNWDDNVSIHAKDVEELKYIYNNLKLWFDKGNSFCFSYTEKEYRKLKMKRLNENLQI